MIVSTIDLEDIRTYRNAKRSRCVTAADALSYPRIYVDFSLSSEKDLILPYAVPVEWKLLRPEEEIAQVWNMAHFKMGFIRNSDIFLDEKVK